MAPRPFNHHRKQKEQQLKAAKRLLAIKAARDDLLTYLRLRMPDPNDPGDVTRSRYVVTPLSRVLCQIIEKVDRGELKRVAVSVGPQIGKSDILSRAGPAWLQDCCAVHDLSPLSWWDADLELARCVAAAGWPAMGAIMLFGLATAGVVYRATVHNRKRSNDTKS